MKKILTALLISLLAFSFSGCTYVSSALLVKNKPELAKPQFNSVPANMKGSPLVFTPRTMKNRFSYYGLDHAE